MFINETKGWYGSLSKIGRDAAIQAFLKLSGYKHGPKKQIPHKIVPKMEKNNLENFRDNLIIIKKYYNTVKDIKKNSNKQKTETNNNKEKNLQFHNYFHPQTEIDETRYINSPTCTKYTPKYSLIFPKLITGTKWKIMSGRTYKKLKIDEKDFLITHESKIDSGYKFMVNMNKTTRRGDIFGNRDVRLRSDKKFDYKLFRKKKRKNNSYNRNKENINNSKKKNNYRNLTIGNNKIISNKIDSLRRSVKLNKTLSIENINNNNNQIDINDEQYLNDDIKANIKKSKSINIKTNLKILLEYKQNKNHLAKKKKILHKTLKKSNDKSENSKKNEISFETKNHTINFGKVISREKYYKIHSKERYLDVGRKINYSLIEERPKTFKFSHSTKNSNIIKQFKGIEPNVDFDANKANNIRVIHPLGKVPNFNLILARPGKKKNPLPSFMQKLFNKESYYSITEKTLKLNEYSKGKLGKVESSFFPKDSFNNIVNIQIIAGKDFEEDIKIDDINRKKDRIKDKMKFKYKSLGKLIKEGALTKFDNITFKSIYKTKRFFNNDLNKYLFGINKEKEETS